MCPVSTNQLWNRVIVGVGGVVSISVPPLSTARFSVFNDAVPVLFFRRIFLHAIQVELKKLRNDTDMSLEASIDTVRSVRAVDSLINKSLTRYCALCTERKKERENVYLSSSHRKITMDERQQLYMMWH